MGLIAKVKDALHHDSNDHKSVEREGVVEQQHSGSAAFAGSEQRVASSEQTRELASAEAAEVHVHDQGVVDEQHNVKAPVVQEKVHAHQHEEIQPVVERERTDVEVRQHVQPIYDGKQVDLHQNRVNAPLQNEVVESIPQQSDAQYEQNAAAVQSSQEVGRETHSSSVNAPIVHETREKRVVDEVQPVIQREIDQTTTVHTTQPIKETVIGAPKVHELRVEPPISIEEFERRQGAQSQTLSTTQAVDQTQYGTAAINTANIREP